MTTNCRTYDDADLDVETWRSAETGLRYFTLGAVSEPLTHLDACVLLHSLVAALTASRRSEGGVRLAPPPAIDAVVGRHRAAAAG